MAKVIIWGGGVNSIHSAEVSDLKVQEVRLFSIRNRKKLRCTAEGYSGQNCQTHSISSKCRQTAMKFCNFSDSAGFAQGHCFQGWSQNSQDTITYNHVSIQMTAPCLHEYWVAYTAYPWSTYFPCIEKVLVARYTKPLITWYRKHGR